MSRIDSNVSSVPTPATTPPADGDGQQLKLQQNGDSVQQNKRDQGKQDAKFNADVKTSVDGKGIAAQQTDSVQAVAAKALLTALEGALPSGGAVTPQTDSDHSALETFTQLKSFLQVKSDGSIAGDFDRKWFGTAMAQSPAGGAALAGFQALLSGDGSDSDIDKLKAIGLSESEVNELKGAANGMSPSERTDQWKSYAKIVEKFMTTGVALQNDAELLQQQVPKAMQAHLEKFLPQIADVLKKYLTPTMQQAQTFKPGEDIPELPNAFVTALEQALPGKQLAALATQTANLTPADLATVQKALGLPVAGVPGQGAGTSAEAPGEGPPTGVDSTSTATTPAGNPGNANGRGPAVMRSSEVGGAMSAAQLSTLTGQLQNFGPGGNVSVTGPATPNFASGDVDALVAWVMMEGASVQDDILRDEMANMQKQLNAKKAERAKISQMKQADAAINSQLTVEYGQLCASGDIDPTKCTQAQYSAWRQMAWGDGQGNPDGSYSGPTPALQALPSPLPTWFKTGDQGASATGGGAQYGFTDAQWSYLTSLFASLPPGPGEAIDTWLQGKGIHKAHNVQEMLENQQAVKGLPGEVSSTTSTSSMKVTKDQSGKHLTTIEQKMEEVAEIQALIDMGQLPPYASQKLTDKMNADKQVITDTMKSGLIQTDADALAAFQDPNSTDPTSLAQVVEAAMTTFGSNMVTAKSAWKKQVDDANTDYQGIGSGNSESDNLVLPDEFGLGADGFQGDVYYTWDSDDNVGGGDNKSVNYYGVQSAFQGVTEGDPRTVNSDGNKFTITAPSHDKSDPITMLLMGAADPTSNSPIPIDGYTNGEAVTAVENYITTEFVVQTPDPQYIAATATDANPANPPPNADQLAGFNNATDSDIATLQALQSWHKNALGEYYDYPPHSDHGAIDEMVSEGLIKWGKSPEDIAADVAAKKQQTTAESAQDKANQAMQLNQTGTIAQFEAVIETEKGNLDSMNDMSEIETMRLQSMLDQRSKLLEALSNIMKQLSQVSETIINNLKS